MVSPSRDDCSLGADNVKTQAVVELHRVRDICPRIEHEVVVPFINDMNRLGEAEAAAISNIVCTQVEYQGQGVHCRSGGGTECRRSLSFLIGQVKQMGILFLWP